MFKNPDRDTIVLALKRLGEALRFREANGLARLFNETAVDDIEVLAESVEKDEEFGGELQDLHEKILAYAASAGPLAIVKDSEQNLRDVRDAIVMIKREVVNFEIRFIYSDLEKVEKWLAALESAIYSYNEAGCNLRRD